AIASGNALLVEKIQMDQDFAELEGAKRRFDASQLQFRDMVAKLHRELKRAEQQIVAFKKDKATWESHTDTPITVDETEYTDVDEGIKAMHSAFSKAGEKFDRDYRDAEIGMFRGFELMRE